MPGGVQGGQGLTGAVGRIAECLHRPGHGRVGLEQLDSDGGVTGVGAAGHRQRAFADQPGVGLALDMGLEPVDAPVHGLVRVPGVGVHGGDHPVFGDPAGDAPAPVGAVAVFGRLHVLAGHQRQQRHQVNTVA